MENVNMCRFAGNDDFIQMREMLLESYKIEQRPCNMFYYYLDNWRFGRDDSESYYQENTILWKKEEKLIAFSILDNEPLYSLQVHPHYNSELPYILEALLKETGITEIAVYEHQKEIICCLEAFGFKNTLHIDNEYEYDLIKQFEKTVLCEGFAIKTAAELKDNAAVCRAQRNVFKAPHMTEEFCAFQMVSKQQAPSYSNESVFLVMDKSNGECAAFAMAWLNKETGVVGFEPIGTVEGYRKKGLSKALLTHIYTAYKGQGFRSVSIRTGSQNELGNALYRSLKPANIYKIVLYERDRHTAV
ncbi:MAG: GNAT family N-acetyltransferase [Bacillota bacterium]